MEQQRLSVYLENLATTLGSREQLAVVEFALALLIRLIMNDHITQGMFWVIGTGVGSKCCKGCN